ncbi:MAG: protease HtpX, partial [Deltaproteobacteria bacterium]|nr:protease HtpX [Deltaproteobacteria bacterium]
QGGMVVAFVLAVVMNVGSYWFSDRIVLSMYKAQELGVNDAPALHRMVDELARKAGVQKPRVYLVPQDAPNAFATGRNPQNGIVAVTRGIVNLLSPDELRGVLAHEMGHIKNRDILVQTIAATIGGTIVMVANMVKWMTIFGFGGRDDEGGGGNPLFMLLMAILAPIAAMIVQMAISRSREYLADRTGAELSGTPGALADALEKLEAYSRRIPLQGGNPATENMFIVNPFAGFSMGSLFSTHPPIAERVARLRAMGGRRY